MLIETLDEAFSFFEGTDVIFLAKYDGLREKNRYSLILIEVDEEITRYEGSDLIKGLNFILQKYLEKINKTDS